MALEQNVQAESGAPEGRARWLKPELKRLDAGAAENALDPVSDFAMNPS